MVNLLFISGSEIVVVGLVVLLLFGAKSIPDVARMLGKGMNEFRRASDEIKRELREQTSDIKKDLDEVRSSVNREVDGLKSSIETDLSEDDPYQLKAQEPGKNTEPASSTEEQAAQTGHEDLKDEGEGPVSRNTKIEE